MQAYFLAAPFAVERVPVEPITAAKGLYNNIIISRLLQYPVCWLSWKIACCFGEFLGLCSILSAMNALAPPVASLCCDLLSRQCVCLQSIAVLCSVVNCILMLVQTHCGCHAGNFPPQGWTRLAESLCLVRLAIPLVQSSSHHKQAVKQPPSTSCIAILDGTLLQCQTGSVTSLAIIQLAAGV